MSDDLSKPTRELLDAARGQDEPSAADRERVHAALLVKLAAAAGAGAAASAGSSAQAATSAGANAAGAGAGAASAGKLGLAAKLALALAVVGGGVGAWQLARREPAPRRPVPEVVATPVAPAPAPAPPAPTPPLAAVPLTPAVPSVPVPPPSAPTPRRAAPVTPAPVAPAPVAPASSTLERETAALTAARAALHDHDPQTALATLDAYERDFPKGLLHEEAAVLRVDALCALGRIDEAAHAATSFLALYPHSPHAARVERGCEGAVSP